MNSKQIVDAAFQVVILTLRETAAAGVINYTGPECDRPLERLIETIRTLQTMREAIAEQD